MLFSPKRTMNMAEVFVEELNSPVMTANASTPVSP